MRCCCSLQWVPAAPLALHQQVLAMARMTPGRFVLRQTGRDMLHCRTLRMLCFFEEAHEKHALATKLFLVREAIT